MSDLDINDRVLAELRGAADIVEVIGEHTRLKKAGRSWKGLCPFHNERTPSFTVDREKGLYHCFGCGAGGDVIHFVRQIDRLDFPEAVEALAGRFGVAIPKRARGPRDDRREKLLEAVARAQSFYAGELDKPKNPAAAYLESRGVPADLRQRLALGYAPDSWDALARRLSGAFPEALLVEAGLLQPRPEAKGAYDRFRNRLLFVLRDDRGRPVGFGGRALADGQEPKYLNSPETPLFQKKRTLYGLSQARDAIRRQERAVLVEGYFDHLALVRAGVEETVATMGTALTPEQAEKLRRLCERVVLCYDGDPAGRAATRAAIALCLAQGLSVSVARMPPGEDPDDVLRSAGPEDLAGRIAGAPDFLTWLLEEVKPGEPGLSAAERSARIAALLDGVKEIPDAILRHEECRRIAEAVSVPLEVLWDRIKPRTGGAPARVPTGTAPVKPVFNDGGIPDAESALLPILVRGGEHISLILGRLKDDWLSRDGVRAIAAAFRAQGPTEPVDFQRIIADLNDEQKNLLAQAVTEEGLEPSAQRVNQVLDKLEQDYLRRESAALLAAIGRSPEDDELLRKKMVTDRRIAELKSSRKGNEIGD
ncbi:MAG TPA: DNA primase [Thermoanaerobaculia bacterium]|jgi:DNA primase